MRTHSSPFQSSPVTGSNSNPPNANRVMRHPRVPGKYGATATIFKNGTSRGSNRPLSGRPSSSHKPSKALASRQESPVTPSASGHGAVRWSGQGFRSPQPPARHHLGPAGPPSTEGFHVPPH